MVSVSAGCWSSTHPARTDHLYPAFAQITQDEIALGKEAEAEQATTAMGEAQDR